MQRPGPSPPKLILWIGKLHSAGAGRCWYETQPPNIPARCERSQCPTQEGQAIPGARRWKSESSRRNKYETKYNNPNTET